MAEVFRVLGIEQAVANFKQMSDAIQNRITRKAVRAATRTIAQAVKAATYKGGRTQRTGLLVRSQAISVSKRADVIVGKLVMRPVDVTGKSKVAQRVRRSKKAKLNNATEMAAFYWRFLERGTTKRTTKTGKNRGRVPAMPWVEPAFDASAGVALDRFSEIFNREIEDEARKLPKGTPR